MTVNQPPPSPPPGITNPGGAIFLHPYLVQVPEVSRSIHITSSNPRVPPLVLKLKVLHVFQVLQADLIVQGTNELLNNMYNIAKPKNSSAFKGRLQCLEESIHDASPHKNIVQEAMSKNTHTATLEAYGEKKDEAPRLRNQHRRRKHQTLP